MNNKYQKNSVIGLDVEHFHRLIELTGVLFFEIDLQNGTCSFYNVKVEEGHYKKGGFDCMQLTNFQTPGKRNQFIQRVVHPEDIDIVNNAILAIRIKKFVTCEARFYLGIGDYFWCKLRLKQICDKEDRPIRVVCTLIDIHDEIDRIKELKQNAESAQKNLRISQIGTHFFYHILSTIRNYTKTDAYKAGKMLYDVSKYLRYKTDCVDIAGSVIPFKEELKSINAYVKLKKAILGDRLTICFDIIASDFMIPVLSVQPYVENAIEHGIENKVNGGTVWLQTKEWKDYFEVTIKDDGVGFKKENLKGKKSVGMKNIEERFSFYENCEVLIESVIGVGTTVILQIRKDLQSDNQKGDLI